MTYTVLNMTPEELMRVEAWCICLRDACLYLELAQNTGNFLTAESSQLMPYESSSFKGHLKIEPLIKRGMIAAAIVLTGSLYKNGDAGPGIAGKGIANLVELRGRAETFSDEFNCWPIGQTGKVLKRDVMAERDGFLTHYDGSRADIQRDPLGRITSWAAPSPRYDASAFEDMKRAITAMHKGLTQFLRDERKFAVMES